MWVCSNCRKEMQDEITLCSGCGTKKTLGHAVVTKKGEASRTFEFGAGKNQSVPDAALAAIANAPVKSATESQPGQIPSAGVPIRKSSPVMRVLNKLAVQPKFWLVLGGAIILVIFMSWGSQQIAKIIIKMNTKVDENFQIDQAVIKKIDGMIQAVVDEKLEWGRVLMQKRMPYRFLEELSLEVDHKKTVYRYDNKAKTAIVCDLLICYHYTHANENTFVWTPVVVYFEYRSGEWILIGEDWIKEAQMVYE